MEINFEKLFLGLLFVLCSMLVITLFVTIFVPKPVKGYSLSNKDNGLYIRKDIDWYEDEKIPLDRSVTYDQAVSLIERLNKTLIK